VRSVLYVDDDADICRDVGATLSLMAGLNVLIASSGAAAITIAHEAMPDLVLMDVIMPGLDGPATLVRMRESVAIAGIPVIFVTANVLPAEVGHLRQLGAIGVIGKPLNLQKLGEEVLTLWDATHLAPQGELTDSIATLVDAEATSLANSFLERTRNDLLRLGHMVDRVREGDKSVLQEIGRVTHSIHGTGAMFGYSGLSAAAGSMEIWVGQATAGIGVADIDDALLKQLLAFMQWLTQELDAAARAAN
jgi:two-component system, OmpR family, response regulator